MPSASLQPSAQTPPPKCPLTGITLIPGAKSEKGFFSLLAIKASIDINAKEAGQTLTDAFEVYKLPASPGQSSVEAMQASIRSQGWTVAFEATKPGVSEQWGWMWRPETPSQRFLVYYLLDKKQSYLAFARSAGSEIVSAAAPPPTTVVTAPPAGTPTTSSVALFERPPPPPATPPRPNAPANTRSGWG